MKYIDKTTKNGKVVKLKNYKKRVRRNKFRRRAVLIIIIFAALAAFLMHAPFMRIKKINCYGNITIPSEQLVKASGFCIGNNIIRVNKPKALRSIAQLPYVKTVKIRRKFPSGINIAVTESSVASYAKLKDTYIYIDEDGKVLEESNVPPETTGCVLSGVTVKEHKIGEVIQFKKDGQFEAYTSLVKEINKSDFAGKVTIIELADINNIKFSVNNRLEIMIGDIENLEYKVNFLASGAYANIGDGRSGTIDVRYGTNATFKEIY